MATLGNPINASTVGQELINVCQNMLQHYEYYKRVVDELTQNVGTTQLQTNAGITDSNQVYQINATISALNALIACYENGLAQPGFNIPLFADQVVGMAG